MSAIDPDELVERRWLCLIKLDLANDRSRFADVGRECVSLLRRWAGTRSEMLCASATGDVLSFLFVSDLPAGAMLAEYQRSQASRNGDAVIFTEVGEEFLASGFGRAATLLQRHPPRR